MINVIKKKKKISLLFPPSIEVYRHESLDRIRSGLLTYILVWDRDDGWWCSRNILTTNKTKEKENEIKVKRESISIYYGLSQYTAFGFIGILESRLFISYTKYFELWHFNCWYYDLLLINILNLHYSIWLQGMMKKNFNGIIFWAFAASNVFYDVLRIDFIVGNHNNLK